jgi:hypothetical protein
MASFWNVEGEDVRESEVKENSFDNTPVPVGWYAGILDKAEIKESDYGKSIKLQADLKVGKDMKKCFLSLKCWEDDPKKRKRAIQMYSLLFKSLGKSPPDAEPDDEILSQLLGKKLGFKIEVYDMTGDDGKQLTGNWLSFVDTAAVAIEKGKENKGFVATEVKKEAPKHQQKPAAFDDFDEDIKF